MSHNSERDALNKARYFYLREISEPRDNSLRVVVQEAIVKPLRSVSAGLPELAELAKGASAIESTEVCVSFELLWTRYAAYLVTEECVGSCGECSDESYEGNLFRVYTKSHFLEYLARDTGGHVDPIKHYKLICLNHLIDVASYAPPEIRVLDPIPNSPARIH